MADDFTFQDKQLQLEAVAKMFLKRKKGLEKKGESSRGLLSSLIKEYQGRGFAFVTRQRLTYHIKKLDGSSNSTVSTAPLKKVSPQGSDSVSTLTAGSDLVSARSHGSSTVVSRPKGGRPSLEALKQRKEHKDRVQEATTEAAKRFFKVKSASWMAKKKFRAPKNSLSSVVAEVEKDFGLLPNTINEETVRSRVKRLNFQGENKAKCSPMENLEDFIVFYCVELARIGSSLKCEEVTQLANDLL